MAVFAFDIPSKIVTVLAPDTSVTCQEVYDVCRDFEDSYPMMSQLPIVDAEGKTNMGSGKFSVVFLFMINGWKIKFEDRPGPSTVVCEVADGNTFGRVGDKNSSEQHPIEASAYTFSIVYQATTGASVETGVSGLTPSESQALLDIDSNVDGLVTDVAALDASVGAMDANIDSLLAAQALTNEQKEAEHTTIPYDAANPTTTGKLVLRNTTVTKQWEADAWEDAAQTIRYQGRGLESIGQLAEVAWPEPVLLWTDSFDVGDQGDPWNSTYWENQADSGTGSMYINAGTETGLMTTGAANGWTHIETIDTGEDRQYLLTYEWLSGAANMTARFIARHDGSWTVGGLPNNGYSFDLVHVDGSNATYAVTRWDSGTPTTIDPGGPIDAPWLDVHKIRISVEGSSLKFRLWDADDTEPTAWTSEVTDNTHTSGDFAVHWSGGTLLSGDAMLYDVSVYA